jgi:tripartite-type tricarboxylate transporter receptor subunit TctC
MAKLLQLLILSTTLALTGASHAQGFPSKTITLIVPTAGGGGPTDLMARALAAGLAPRIGQPVVVENRPGAGSYLGGEIVARSAPDGHTLLVNALSGLHSDLFVKGQAVVLSRELVPIAAVAEGPLVIIAPASLPVTNLREFVAHVRANPKKLNVAVFPNTVLYLDMVRFMKSAGLEMTEIPYNSSAAITTAMVAGDVHMYFSSLSTPKPFIESGRIRALAMTSPERFALEPGTPTAREQGFDLDVSSYFAVLGPVQTAASVVSLLNQRINEALETPEARDVIRKLGMTRASATPAQLAAKLAAESKALRETAATVGVKPQ